MFSNISRHFFYISDKYMVPRGGGIYRTYIFFEGDFYTKLTHASLHNDTFNSFLTIESQKKPQTQLWPEHIY